MSSLRIATGIDTPRLNAAGPTRVLIGLITIICALTLYMVPFLITAMHSSAPVLQIVTNNNASESARHRLRRVGMAGRKSAIALDAQVTAEYGRDFNHKMLRDIVVIFGDSELEHDSRR